MNRGVNKQAVFFRDSDRLDFGRQLAEIHTRFGVQTLAYCLMTNHYHLVLRAPDHTLSRAMHYLGTAFTTRVNLRAGRDGPLFRGRYHSIPVETETYLTWAVRYIHRNPLDIAGVSNPAAYRWSSYRTYLGLRAAPSFLATDLVLDLFNDDRGALLAFTESETDDAFGTEPLLTDLFQLIEFEIRSDDLTHGEQTGSGAWLAHSLMVLLMSRSPQHPLAPAIDHPLGYPSENARQKAIRRADARLAADPALRRILNALATRFDIPEAA